MHEVDQPQESRHRWMHRTGLGASTLIFVILASLAGCNPGRTDEDVSEGGAPAMTFWNASTSVKFVGDDACFDCHEDQYRGYQTHGMARSLYPLTEENVVEAIPGPVVRHPESGYTYRVVRQNERIVQEERISDGADAGDHLLSREMKYVVGSGSAARTYLAESNGRLYQLPLTWYTQSERWDFSPGYADAPIRFDRLVPDRCMACHNSYPETVPFVEGKYLEVPHGIGCERCHGPGELHVQARLESPEPADSIDPTIVNPAHLTLERRLDVCQQCHLHGTVSLLRDGRTAFDFRPSQALEEFITLFSSDSGPTESIRVISHADRMQMSPCFRESAGRPAAMDCVTCHDPHQGFRDFGPDYFNRRCTDCHDPSSLAASMPGAALRAQHDENSNCFSCHMPRIEAEDAPHASFTDHFIRVVRDVDTPSTQSVDDGLVLEPYFSVDRSGPVGSYYAGMAYIALARQESSTDLLERGIALLESTLAQVPDSAGEGHFLLGIAYGQTNRPAAAVRALETAVSRGPSIPERLNALAQAYEARATSPGEAERLYRQALQIQPSAADVRVNLGRFLEAQGRLAEARREYQLAVAEQPWLETAHFNLGTAYLREGDLERAEAALLQAIALRPTYVEARGNLAVLYLQTDRVRDAAVQFERAAELSPDHPVALANLGSFYLNHGDVLRAVPLLARATELAPEYATAHANLAVAYVNLDRPNDAERHAVRALEIDPSNGTAQQVLRAVR